MTWAWRIYCGLLLAGGVVQMLRKVLTDTGGPSSRYAALASAVALTAVLAAKARGRALSQRWIWQVLSVALVAGWLVMLSFAIYLATIAVQVGAGLLGLGAVLALPGVQQVWVYGWRSSEIWSRERREAPEGA